MCGADDDDVIGGLVVEGLDLCRWQTLDLTAGRPGTFRPNIFEPRLVDVAVLQGDDGLLDLGVEAEGLHVVS